MIYRIVVVIALFAFSVLLGRWVERGDYYDWARGRHHCGAPPSAIDDWSFTHRARKASDLANLDRWVRRHGDEVNRLFDVWCWAPLHFAARFGRDDLAERLIAGGADVRTRDEPDGNTALHLAAQYGQADVARVLVAHGADVNAANRWGRTPLHDAASGLGGTSDLEGRVAVATLLIAHGADVNARERGDSRTPLDAAAGVASINPASSERMTALLLAAGANPRAAAAHGDSPLHQAVAQGNVAVVRRLLDGGADPNEEGTDTTPLGVAAHRGNAEVVALLLDRGATANRTVPGSRVAGYGAALSMALLPERDGSTPERDARRLQIVRLLLDRGADVDAADRQGRTALHATASRGELPLVELLLTRRATVDAVDVRGLTPLHLAVREGHVAVAARLLDNHADVRIKAGDGRTAVEFAAGDREMEALVRRYATR